MCGIVGVAGDISARVRDVIFPDLLDVCQLRGRDSTGIIRVDNALNYTWVKRVGPPAYLFDTREYDSAMRCLPSVLVGHCRHKTVGAVSTKTAHPFDFEKEGICGVHNGTLGGAHELDTYHYEKVDSEVLFGHLAVNGPEETFNQTKGSWCCVWWNAKEKTLNFIRNDERPLWFTWSEDCKRMYWASEPWMFNAVARKEKLWDGGKSKQVYVPLPVNTLWRFKITPNPRKDEKILTLRTPVEIEPKKVEVRSYSGNPSSVSNKDGKNDWEIQANGTWVRKEKAKEGEEAKVTNPFVAADEKDGSDLLNDNLPNELQSDTTQENGTNTQLGTLDFLKHSLKSSTSSTPPNSSAPSKKSILSLPKTISKTSAQISKDASSDASQKSSNVVPLLSARKAVDVRDVLGSEYITDMKTKTEYTKEQFEKNTEGICFFCKDPIGDLKEVAEFVTENKFVCTSCVKEPNVAIC